MKYTLRRVITKEECPGLPADLPIGTEVYLLPDDALTPSRISTNHWDGRSVYAVIDDLRKV